MSEPTSPLSGDDDISRVPAEFADSAPTDPAAVGKLGLFDCVDRVLGSTGKTARLLIIVIVLLAALVGSVIAVSQLGSVELGPVRIGHVGAATIGTAVSAAVAGAVLATGAPSLLGRVRRRRHGRPGDQRRLRLV